MAKPCKKCNGEVPAKAWIDGKRRNLKNRKYCFECSPFGQHNTRQLEFDEQERQDGQKNGKRIRFCPDCKEEHNQHANRCFRCYFNRRKKEVSKKVREIVGSACWICGYDKTKRNLCFHHIDKSTKEFSLTTRELMLKWERVFAEMKKCIFVCANCHGEIHAGIVKEKRVQSIWKRKWS